MDLGTRSDPIPRRQLLIMTPPRGLGPIRASVCFPAQSRRCSSTPHSVTLDPSFGEICNSTLQGQFSTPKSANEKG